MLFQIYTWSNFDGAIDWDVATIIQIALYPLIYLSLILIRWRPYNIAMLAFALGYYTYRIAMVRIGS